MMFKVFLFLCVAVAATSAIVCRKDFCKNVKCEELTECLESNGQKVRKNGGYCNCCDICVKVLGEGEKCIPEGEFFGIIITEECAEGLVCDKNLRQCIKPAEYYL